MPPSEPPAAGEAVTPGGYAYTVVHEDEPAAPLPPRERRPARTWQLRAPALIALALVPAAIAGVAVWLLLSLIGGGGGDGDRVNRNVSNVVNAFSQQDGATTLRFEGELAPGFPDGVPSYPGADVVSSVLQLRGDDASYLVVYDTGASRQEVADYFEGKFGEDPWQIDAGQDGRDSSLRQFSRVDDADVTGLVLAAESTEGELTTIVLSLQVVSGADAAGEQEAFEPGEGRRLPAGFPDEVPQYPGSTALESLFQKQPGVTQFSVSFVTKDDIADVLDYYREQFRAAGWTVEDADPGSSPLQDAEAITFADEGQRFTGQVSAGEFPDDENFNQIDILLNQSTRDE